MAAARDAAVFRLAPAVYVGGSVLAAAVAVSRLSVLVGARNLGSAPERFVAAFQLLHEFPVATLVLCTRRSVALTATLTLWW
jgi:hypothetical protein